MAGVAVASTSAPAAISSFCIRVMRMFPQHVWSSWHAGGPLRAAQSARHTAGSTRRTRHWQARPRARWYLGARQRQPLHAVAVAVATTARFQPLLQGELDAGTRWYLVMSPPFREPWPDGRVGRTPRAPARHACLRQITADLDSNLPLMCVSRRRWQGHWTAAERGSRTDQPRAVRPWTARPWTVRGRPRAFNGNGRAATANETRVKGPQAQGFPTRTGHQAGWVLLSAGQWLCQAPWGDFSDHRGFARLRPGLPGSDKHAHPGFWHNAHQHRTDAPAERTAACLPRSRAKDLGLADNARRQECRRRQAGRRPDRPGRLLPLRYGVSRTRCDGCHRTLMTSDAPACPECGRPMRSGGFVLSRREDDGRRTCRTLWRCAGGHVWWRWADRPEEPLEVCPVPALFR